MVVTTRRHTMSSIAHLDTAALDTAAKFFRTMQKAGADFTGPLQSVGKRANLAAYLALGCPKVDGNGVIDTTPTPESLARLLLGADFITPEEVTAGRGLSYDDEQLEGLEASFPSIEVIAWCRGNDYMLLPAPPTAMSLLGIRDLNRTLFCSKEGGWYAESRQEFSRSDKTEVATWLAIRKGVVPNSTSKKWKEQLSLLSDVERVPNAAEFAWGLTTYKKVRGVYLMSGPIYARTNSVDSDDNHVFVGFFDERGLVVHIWRDVRYDGIGLASARKF
jgi:hypothetical protein